VRLDTANRSFAGLTAVSALAGMLALCGAVGCVLIALLISRLADEGLSAFADEPAALWPALAFIAIVGVGALLGVLSLRRQIRASRALARRVDALELPLTSELRDAAVRAGLIGRVKLVDSDERFSFAYGALAPRVVVSSGLAAAAEPQELDAVLSHERYHVRNLDPLKVMLSRALPKSFYYVPLLGGLHSRYVAARELAADRRAVASNGREPLAGALYKVLSAPAWPELSAAAAIGGPEQLDARLAQLEQGSEPPLTGPSRRTVALSLLGAATLTALFAIAVTGFGGPSAIADLTGDSLTVLDVGGAILCAVPWVLGGWLGFRWLAARTRRPLDTNGSKSTTLG
jgi:beta-lactamase regulating signal transducer with metallopeptidase domain